MPEALASLGQYAVCTPCALMVLSLVPSGMISAASGPGETCFLSYGNQRHGAKHGARLRLGSFGDSTCLQYVYMHSMKCG